MKRQDLENDLYHNLVNKCVYFMHNDKIITGQITSRDSYQLFVGENYCIQNDQDFFFTIDELIDSIKNEIINT